MDLAEAVEFDWDAAYNNIQAVRPGMPVFQVSAKSGDGMERFLGFLATRFVELRQAAVERTPAA
jgi:hydrogenase nickel incorporation protein HypB